MNLTEKIVAMVFRAQGSMTLDELSRPGAEEKVAEKIAGELDEVLSEQWAKGYDEGLYDGGFK